MPVSLVISFTINPSLMSLRIGIPPATEASKEKNKFLSSAISANSLPYFAISALLAVITALLFFKAEKHKSFATPSSPPINSTITSILLSNTISVGLSKNLRLFISTFLFLFFDLAETATNSIWNKFF